MDMELKKKIEDYLHTQQMQIQFDDGAHRYKINGDDAVGVSEFLNKRWYTLTERDFTKFMWFDSYDDEVETVISWHLLGETACRIGDKYHKILEQALKTGDASRIDDFCSPAYEFCNETYQNSIVFTEQRYMDSTIKLCGTADVIIVDSVNKVIRIHDFKVVSKSLNSKFLYFDNELSDESCSKRRYYSLQLGCYKFLVYENLKNVIDDIDEYEFETLLIVLRRDIYEKNQKTGGSKNHLQILETEKQFTDFAFDYLSHLKVHKISAIDLLLFQ